VSKLCNLKYILKFWIHKFGYLPMNHLNFLRICGNARRKSI